MFKFSRYLTAILMSCIILTGIHVVSPLQPIPASTTSGDFTKIPDLSKGQGPFKDGEHTGTASGYHGETTVSVAVQHGWITSLSIIKSGDDKEYLDKCKAPLLKAVLEKQETASIEAISGATFSSNGILDAIDQAVME